MLFNVAIQIKSNQLNLFESDHERSIKNRKK